MEAHVDWTSPAALWRPFPERRDFRTPAIFRFASDAYMQELLDLMQTHPHRIAERIAAPETWTKRAPEHAPIVPKRGLLGKLERARATVVQKLEEQQTALVRVGPLPSDSLKLFHPAAQRYYVIAASLICRTLGLPDHPVNTSAQEKVSFVMRLVDGANEFAFVNGAWQTIAGDALAEGEELNLMSPLTYLEDDGRRRRMYNGVIPVAKREAYVGAPLPKAPPNALPLKDPREISLIAKVLSPWGSLEDIADGPAIAKRDKQTDDDVDNAQAAAIIAANAQIKEVSALILADLDAWLQENLEPVWSAVHGTGTISDPKHLEAFNQLGSDLRQALNDPSASFQFIVVDKNRVPEIARANGKTTRETLQARLVAALPADVPTNVPLSAIAQASASVRTSPFFVARCVYERPSCGTVKPVVSDPTVPFQLASFFDPDAPARPIRVEMPADTTADGLRKYDKNTSFVMSDILCGQVQELRGLTFADLVLSVLPFPFKRGLKKGGGSIGPCTDGGMVCSLSIPIITLCALILLMIFVKLLDAVFFWLPFFQICLPTKCPGRNQA